MFRLIRWSIIFIITLWFLAGCTKSSIREDYNGAVAFFDESNKKINKYKWDYYVLSGVDGTDLWDSISETLGRNQGRGFKMTPYLHGHIVPAGKNIVLSLQARSVFAAPILSFGYPNCRFEAEVVFKPEENADYVIRGTLEKDYSAIWIVDLNTDQVVLKVENNELDQCPEPEIREDPLSELE